MKEFSFQADEGLRKIAHEVCAEVNPEIQVFEGRIASGDQFVCDQGVKDNIVKSYVRLSIDRCYSYSSELDHVRYYV